MPNTFFDNKTATVNCLPSQDDEIDWGKLLATLDDNQWLIAFIAVVVLSIGIAKVLFDKPVYKADVMLHVDENSPSQGAPEPVVALMDSEVPGMAEIEFIKSRRVLGATVKNLNLEIIAEPKYFPLIGEAIARRFQQHNEDDEISGSLFGQPGYAWGGESIQVDTFTVPSNWLGKELILIAGKQGHFRLMYEDGLVLEGEVGKLASNKQQSVMLLVSLLKSRPDTQFNLMRQSEGTAISQLQDAITVTEKGKKTGVLALTMESTSPDLAFQTLNEVANNFVRQDFEQKSPEAQIKPEPLEKQPSLPKEQLAAVTTTALNDDRTRDSSTGSGLLKTPGVSTSVVDLQTQIKQLRQKRHVQRQSFSKSHPSVVAIDRQIAHLQEQMNSNGKKIEVIPETQQDISTLASNNVNVYTVPPNPQALRASKAGTVGNVRIIDYAILPTEPVNPQKAMIIAGSFMLGLILGVALAFIRKYLYRGVEDPDLIEKQLNIPVYVTIPHSKQQENINNKLGKKQQNDELAILALENNHDLAIESLRSLRTTLHFAFLDAQNNVIMITSPSPGVGKSFVAINLAAVLADAGKKVLLIDGDLRKGFLNNVLSVRREQGLSEFISNTITLDVAIQKVPTAHFDFIATGAIPPNPSELLLHERFSIFLDNISKRYDHVIIDSPPILAVTDAAIIGRMSSATLMVIRAGQHPMRELEQSTKRLLQAGVNINGIVFNDVPESSFRSGYGQYIYQYSDQKNQVTQP